MFETINYEVKDSIGILTITREKALNAINDQVMAELSQKLDEIKEDKELRGLIVTGAGRSFVAGADIATQSVMNEPEGF